MTGSKVLIVKLPELHADVKMLEAFRAYVCDALGAGALVLPLGTTYAVEEFPALGAVEVAESDIIKPVETGNVHPVASADRNRIGFTELGVPPARADKLVGDQQAALLRLFGQTGQRGPHRLVGIGGGAAQPGVYHCRAEEGEKIHMHRTVFVLQRDAAHRAVISAGDMHPPAGEEAAAEIQPFG